MTAIETPEQAADHAAKLAAARKAKDAERKREERKRLRDEKEKAAAEKKASEAKSFPEYWQQQRANLTEAQRTEYEQRESDVLDLQFAMRKYVEGTYESQTKLENQVPLKAIIEEVHLWFRDCGRSRRKTSVNASSRRAGQQSNFSNSATDWRSTGFCTNASTRSS
jgi:hypothetical protein